MASDRAFRHCDPKQRKADANRARRQAIRDFLSEYMVGKACVDCGESDDRVLDFDHRDGTEKKLKIADALRLRVGLNQLAAELEKCDILCSNCHRKKHRPHGRWCLTGKDSRFHDYKRAA